MKRRMAGVLAAALLLTALATAAGAVERVAVESTVEVLLDGQRMEFPAYALKNQQGYLTNYLKLRDVAWFLADTPARFRVNWDGRTRVTTGRAPMETEKGYTPLYGDQPYQNGAGGIWIDGRAAELEAILLTDDQGGGHTYFKLRDLGAALGFRVDWDDKTGCVVVETGAAALEYPGWAKPYGPVIDDLFRQNDYPVYSGDNVAFADLDLDGIPELLITSSTQGATYSCTVYDQVDGVAVQVEGETRFGQSKELFGFSSWEALRLCRSRAGGETRVLVRETGGLSFNDWETFLLVEGGPTGAMTTRMLADREQKDDLYWDGTEMVVRGTLYYVQLEGEAQRRPVTQGEYDSAFDDVDAQWEVTGTLPVSVTRWGMLTRAGVIAAAEAWQGTEV